MTRRHIGWGVGLLLVLGVLLGPNGASAVSSGVDCVNASTGITEECSAPGAVDRAAFEESPQADDIATTTTTTATTAPQEAQAPAVAQADDDDLDTFAYVLGGAAILFVLAGVVVVIRAISLRRSDRSSNTDTSIQATPEVQTDPIEHRHIDPEALASEEAAPGAPPGWYTRSGGEGPRYWDGRKWDDRPAPPSMPAQLAPINFNPVKLWAPFVFAAGVIVGSVGPWASAFVITVNGTSGDGIITLVAGIIVIAVLALDRQSKVRITVGVLGGLLAVAVATYDLIQIYGTTSEFFGQSVQVASPGWGIWLVGISGIGVIISVIVADT